MTRMLICFVTLFLMTSLLGVSLHAQGSGLRLKGVIGQIESGLSWTQVDNINQIITHPDSGYLPFDKAIFSFGFGIERYFGRIIYGGNFYGYVINAPGQDDFLFRLAILNYYYGTLKIGYAVLQSPDPYRPFYIYPSVGIGGGTSLFRASPTGFANYNKYYGTGLMLDASLNISSLSEMPGSKYSMKIGARIGYMYGLGNGWDISEYTPQQETPLVLSPQGPYFRISFGMGRVK